MTDKEKKSGAQGKTLENFFAGLGRIGLFILRVSWHGISRAILGNADYLLWLAVFYSGLFFLVYWHWMHLVILNWVLPGVFTENVVRFLVFHVSQFTQFLWLVGLPTIALGVIFGAAHFLRMAKFQKDLKHIGLKSATGAEPKVIDVEEPEPFKKKITLASQGIGLDHYKGKKSDLESCFGAIVEDIRISEKSRKLVEIYLAEKELPTMVNYRTCVGALQEPYSFLVGESLGGVLAQNIRSLPHLLIAGTSGNGKSVFFNQALISLLRTSPHAQLYLLDLKLGVEVKAYSGLPNVRIAKDANEAVNLLQAVVAEMALRFQYLEEKGRKLIEPERDRKDLIIVGVDEASVLYKKKSGDRGGGSATNMARELTDEITKLGRAAGIHLIAATQKVTTKTIDTDVQENIGGRVCFRVGTLQGSNTVLGNKKAFELPDVKGRAIWSRGNDFIEVQTPFLSEEMIEQEIKGIKAEFDQEKRKCLQEMVADRKLDKAKAEQVQNRALDKAS